MNGSDYFTAVQIGRARVKKSLERLQEAAGPSYPVLFLKMGTTDWTPVGDGDFIALVSGKGGTAAVVICDSEGNSKAMSSWLSRGEAERISKEMAANGLGRYEGEIKLPV